MNKKDKLDEISINFRKKLYETAGYHSNIDQKWDSRKVIVDDIVRWFEDIEIMGGIESADEAMRNLEIAIQSAKKMLKTRR